MKRLYLITCLLLLCAYTHAQSAWNKVVDFCPDTIPTSNAVAQYADDDRIVVAGHIQENNVTNHICYIATLDYNGNLLHHKSLEAAGKENGMPPGYFEKSGYPLTKVAKDKYLLCGVELDLDANQYHFAVYQPFFYFFNEKCDSLRMVKYTDTIVSRLPFSIISDDQGNIVVTGTETSRQVSIPNWDTTYVWLAKYDADANLIWSKKIVDIANKDMFSIGNKIIKGNDGNSYLIGGAGYNKSNDKYDQFIMKTNLDGDVLWLKFLPRKYVTYGSFDIVPTKDGNYAFINTYADTTNWPYIPTDTYYGKFDEAGDTIWTRHFSKIVCTNEGLSIAEAENEDLLLLSSVYYDGYDHFTVMRTTPKGNIKWYREYEYIDTSLFKNKVAAFTYTPTRQILLSGHFTSFSPQPGIFDTAGLYSWFVLTDTFGCIEPGCQVGDTVWWLTDVNEIAARQVAITIYPNPATNIVYIQAANTPKKLNAVLRDMSGRTLSTTPLQSNGKTPVNIAHLPQGLYMLEVWDEAGRIKVFKVNKE